jgi:hypothetical protein
MGVCIYNTEREKESFRRCGLQRMEGLVLLSPPFITIKEEIRWTMSCFLIEEG